MKTNAYRDCPRYQKKILINRFVSSTSIGYIVARLFTSINPMQALMFNAIAEMINFISNKMFTYLKKYRFFYNPKFESFKPFFKATILFTSTFLLMNCFAGFSLTNALTIVALTALCQLAFGILGIGALIGSFAKYSLDILIQTKIIKA